MYVEGGVENGENGGPSELEFRSKSYFASEQYKSTRQML